MNIIEKGLDESNPLMKQLAKTALEEVRRMPAVAINDVLAQIVEDIKDILPESVGVVAETYVSKIAERIKPYVEKLPIPEQYVDEVAEIIAIYLIEYFIKPSGFFGKVMRGVKIKVIADIIAQFAPGVSV